MAIRARWVAALVATVCIVALVLFGITRPASSNDDLHVPSGAPRLVLLGGSIAAGVGLAPRSASNQCGRTNASFGNLIAKAKHFRLIQVACASARSGQVIHGQPHRQGSQLELTSDDVRGSIVIIGPLGGNDVNWLGEEDICLLHGCAALTANRSAARNTHRVYDPNIDGAVYRARLGQLGKNLEAIFRTLKREHPREIIVDEYYAVTQGHPDCLIQGHKVTGATRRFSDADSAFLTNRLHRLNATIAASAAGIRGIRVKLVKPNFAGHGVCAAHPWVAVSGFHNGAKMHPTTEGQRALARANEAALLSHLARQPAGLICI